MNIKLLNVRVEDQKRYLEKLNDTIDDSIEILNEITSARPMLRIECDDIESYNEIVQKLKNTGFYIFNKKSIVNPINAQCIGSIEFTLDCNMLIVGNGFDLAHGLKTRYKDFLESINTLLSFSRYKDNTSYTEEDFQKQFKSLFGNLDTDIDEKYQIIKFYNSIKENISGDIVQDIIVNKMKFSKIHLNNRDNKSSFEIANKVLSYIIKHNNMFCRFSIQWALIDIYIEDNTMIKYFLNIYNKNPLFNKIQDNNWVDVELEIYKIINCVEDTIQNINATKISGLDYEEEIDQTFSPLIFFKSIKEKPDIIQKNIKEGEVELDRLKFLLENYLGNIEKTKKETLPILADINDISLGITHLLSFNYTDTFRNRYFKNNDDICGKKIDDEHTDFIHGKIGGHNLVLGTNETLDTNYESKMLDCVYFKKYFQRVYNKTGAKYSKWLKEVSFKTIYIFGHSLDVTDKEVLKEIIDNDNVGKIVIYYHNEAHHRQEIVNLIKILGKNDFLQYRQKGRIEFKEQSKEK